MAKDIQINGLEEAMKMMDKLPLQMKGNALRSVHRKAMTEYFVKPARAEKPEFKKAWKVTNTRDDKTGVIGAPYRGTNAEGNWNSLLLWEEYGTASRQTKAGADRGIFQQKRPFVRNLVARNTKPMIRFLNSNYGDLIIKYLERQKKTLTRRAAKLGI
jgi:hypothetical protein